MGEDPSDGSKAGDDPEVLYRVASAEDFHCEMQASIVVLVGDDLLQRFASKVLGRKISLEGFGPEYRGVRLTSLLRAKGAERLFSAVRWKLISHGARKPRAKLLYGQGFPHRPFPRRRRRGSVEGG